MSAAGRRDDPPVHVRDSLAEIVRELRDDPTETTSVASMGGVFGRWQEAVGVAVAAHVQPVRLDGTRLVVEVDDPAWATQLRFLEATMKSRLAEVAGARIDAVDVRVRRT